MPPARPTCTETPTVSLTAEHRCFPVFPYNSAASRGQRLDSNSQNQSIDCYFSNLTVECYSPAKAPSLPALLQQQRSRQPQQLLQLLSFCRLLLRPAVWVGLF